MKNRAFDLRGCTFSSTDTLLFDANIWLFLFPTPSSSSQRYVGDYSLAFKKMLIAKAKFAVDVLVLSEYVNRYCRIVYRASFAGSFREFKDFRDSPSFSPTGKAVAECTREILRHCTRHDHPFSSIDIAGVLVDLESGKSDFNDGLIAGTCREHGWKLVTDDRDFTSGGIDVLTVNPKLLAACR